MARFAKYMLIAALMVSIGAQWAVLQSAAWMGMAVSYSIQAGSVSDGLSATFDGKHPCPICAVIAKSKQGEKKSAAISTKMPKQKMTASHSAAIFIPAPEAQILPRAVDEVAVAHRTSPPVPPPRVV